MKKKMPSLNIDFNLSNSGCNLYDSYNCYCYLLFFTCVIVGGQYLQKKSNFNLKNNLKSQVNYLNCSI